MIFTFSSSISIQRKLVYVGSMLLVSGVVISSILGSWNNGLLDLGAAFHVCVIAGISLILLPWIYPDTKRHYMKGGVVLLVVLMSLIPIILHILLYLISIALFSSIINTDAVLHDISIVVMVDVPLIAVGTYLLHRELTREK